MVGSTLTREQLVAKINEGIPEGTKPFVEAYSSWNGTCPVTGEEHLEGNSRVCLDCRKVYIVPESVPYEKGLLVVWRVQRLALKWKLGVKIV